MTELRALAQKPNISSIHQALERQSIKTDELYLELGLSKQEMSAENSSISMAKYLAVLELAAKRSGRRFLSVDMALDGRNNDLGILGYILRNAADFKSVLELLNQYVGLISPGSHSSVEEGSEECVWIYEIATAPSNECIQDVEATLVQFALMVRQALGDKTWQPSRFTFAHSSPSATDLAAFPFDSELVFDHPFNSVSFPKSIMALTSSEAPDPELLAVLEARAQQLMEDLVCVDTIIDRVRILIAAHLGERDVTVEAVASDLAMSRRTLYRRLQEEGTSFSSLREAVTLQMAKETLARTTISIAELALRLGYSESSGFNRAFKRWTGVNPLEYRRRHNRG